MIGRTQKVWKTYAETADLLFSSCNRIREVSSFPPSLKGRITGVPDDIR